MTLGVRFQTTPGATGKEMITDWGTGEVKGEAGPVNQQVSKHPTWHYSGQPVEQHYGLTQLKLSNVRSNDQLLPESHKSDMGPLAIERPFPADHPYSSHICRRAVFPKFDSSEDHQRGLAAKNERPINSEMPATAHDVTIVSKTKGFGIRREVQANPSPSNRTPLHWLGEDGFDQVTKSHGQRKQYYPTPTKTLAPNLQKRTPEHTLSDRSANTLRNLERHQWMTSYDMSHTGHGDSGPIGLDNYDAKMEGMAATGIRDDKLRPHTSRAFTPARPYEGRISRGMRPPSRARSPAPKDESDYIRMLTSREVSEDLLHNGQAYKNLPGNVEFIPTNIVPENVDKNLVDGDSDSSHEEPRRKKKMATINVDPEKVKMAESIQQLEAENRWKELELEKPGNDIEQLKLKYGHLVTKEQPETFYEHEGKYNEERAGMYQTSYDPSLLAHSMNVKDGTAVPSEMLNQDLKSAHPASFPPGHEQDWLGYSRNMGHEKIRNDGAFRGINSLKETQKQILQPSFEQSRASIQEGDFIRTESTKNHDYDTPKFLQTNPMPAKSEVSPRWLMSNENQNLENTRMASNLKRENTLKKSVKFAENIKQEFDPLRTTSLSKLNKDLTYKDLIDSRKENYIPQPTTITHLAVKPSATTKFNNSRRPGSTNGRDDFRSLSSNFVPTGMRHTGSDASAYQKQFPIYTRQQLSVCDDPRFQWQPGHGQPRPQTTLLYQQANFDRSDIHRRFHNIFGETNPDLRENIYQGKKHSFSGMNAQEIHG